MCDLPVIGISRPPKASDLRERGLTGLPDPDPLVVLLRAKLENEQAKLNTQVDAFYAEQQASSSVRTEIGSTEAENSEENGEAIGRSGNIAPESEKGEGKEEANKDITMMGDEQAATKLSPAPVETSIMPESLVANQMSNVQKGQRNLRVRNPIQLRSYGLEHEEYRQMLKAGGAKARSKRV